MVKPSFIHDCEKCRFLGTVVSIDNPGCDTDLYFCASSISAHSSVIARYSNDGPDYSSTPVLYVTGLRDLMVAKILSGHG